MDGKNAGESMAMVEAVERRNGNWGNSVRVPGIRQDASGEVLLQARQEPAISLLYRVWQGAPGGHNKSCLFPCPGPNATWRQAKAWQ